MPRLTPLLIVPLMLSALAGCTPFAALLAPQPTLTTRDDAADAVTAAYALYADEADAARIQKAAEAGLEASGATGFDVTVTGFSESSIVAQICEDISDHHSVDASGVNVVSLGAPIRRAYEVVYAVHGSLVMTSRTEIPREEGCGSSPMFDDAETARAAAHEAYSAYLTVLGNVYADGGHGAERLAEHSTPEWVELASVELAGIAMDGLVAIPDGTMTFSVAPEQPTITHNVLRVLVCADFDGLRFTDSHGDLFQLNSRTGRMAIDVIFRQTDRLLIAAETVRPNLDACGW